MAALHDLNQGEPGVMLRRPDRQVRRQGRLVAVPQPIRRGEERAVGKRLDQVPIPRFVLSGQGPRGGPPFDPRAAHGFHFAVVTVVPLPTRETISNSSISRLTPGSPSPRLPDVE